MFDKVQQLNELRKMRSQAMDLQKKLREIKTTTEYRGIEVTVNGEQKVEKIIIDGDENDDLIEAINRAMKEVQKKAAKKMMDEGGGLSGLLKGF
ncbi:YbaB/EbfC family nucleoid-associated protein [Candidatus Woesebacteria bacterium]|nr:YbaB/EbfC family nucleoid-associated protein [Candidatus Woesebacteria bacterium]QQG47384.1 MAG: YbaB/EbfC family nucleoid-associated protein [Candidatus Woesebacteria bacterium]